MRKTIALLLALSFLMALAPVSALAASRTFKFDKTAKVDRGYVTISWVDSANYGPYEVSYSYDNSSTQSKVHYWANGNSSNSTTSSKSLTLKLLIPGVDYIIRVEDKYGNKIEATYTMYDAGTFEDGRLKASSLTLESEYRSYSKNASDKTAKKVSSFKASTIENNLSSTNYGIYVKINYPKLARARTYRMLVATVAPNGYRVVDTSDSLSFEYTSGGYYYYYCLGEHIFDTLYENCGYIPTGTYRMELYLDGMYVGKRTFTVK